MKLSWFTASEANQGSSNHDRLCVVAPVVVDWKRQHGLFAVADGVGGTPGGEVAADLALATLANPVIAELAELNDVEAEPRQPTTPQPFRQQRAPVAAATNRSHG